MFIKKFKEISRRDTDIAGGKGASLGEMTQAGLPVPQGFVVLSSAYEDFITATGLSSKIEEVLAGVDYDDAASIDDASEKIGDLVTETSIPGGISDEIEKYFDELGAEFVAVRSSATAEDSASAAWAGQLETYLNTGKENLLENIRKCWASLYTPRAIFYRKEKGLLDHKISVAVVVQEMVESEKAGIAFSVHPVTQDVDQMIIEAGIGLGEAVVSGSITPDSYVVSKKDNNVIDISVSGQQRGLFRGGQEGNEWVDLDDHGKEQKLSDEEIIELAAIVKQIEGHYGVPQDIEWALSKGKFFITQSRPITTLDIVETESIKGDDVKYTLHFTVSDFSVLFLDMVFNNQTSYGVVDYVVLYDQGIVRSFLSEKGMKECYEMSKNLLDDSFYNELMTDAEDLVDFLKAYEPLEADESNLTEYWERSIQSNDNYGRIYRYFEQPFQQALEEELLRLITKEEIVEIMTSRNIEALKDDQSRKFAKRLLEMGEMKLKIHANAEKYFNDYPVLSTLSKKYDIPINLIGAMRKAEVEDLIDGKITVATGELERRLEGCVYVKEDGAWNIYAGAEFESWKNKLLMTHDGEVTGDTAYPGRVKGRAVVHLSWIGITEIEEGDIVVAGMTNPQMIPLLKKASAIITDEGGITCHAAIIARELKKPCIVGAKNATYAIKDGDIIDVDADHGIVKIVKKVQ